MPNTRPQPTLRRRRLGNVLRQLRNSAGLTLDAVASEMTWDPSKLSRIENATGTVRTAELARLATLYGADAQMTSALVALARDAGKRGWWQTYSGVLRPAYADLISLESDAESLETFETLLIPGLLQTAAYAHEVISATTSGLGDEAIAALVDVRQARQSVLSRSDSGGPLKLWAIVHEAALRQRFPLRPTVMKDQLRRLVDVAERPNIKVQVLPLEMTPNPASAGAFSVLRFPGSAYDLVAFENLRGPSYLEGTKEVSTFREAFSEIRAAALPVDDSIALVRELEGKA